ncbi:alpha/beta hydrolase [Kitasatospora sp. NPDC054939]
MSHRAVPAVLAAALLAGCSGGGDTAAGPTATPSTPPAPTAAATPTATPAPAPKPTGEADPALRPFYTQQLAWAACPDDPQTAKADESVVQCATLKVPLDYAAPAGATLDVAVTRHPAAKQDQRIGSLLVNPGGPGGSGNSLVKRGHADYDGPLHDRFDVVGFDPRGVGATSPVNCLDDTARDEWLNTDTPGDAHGKTLADACGAKYAALLPFVGSRSTVRDMDVLRGALGDRTLHYLGLSYGTYLGSLYAEEFPDRVGRLALDGAVDRSTDLLRHNVEQYAGFERSFRLFAEDCAEQKQCPLGKDPATAPQKLADFLDGVKDRRLTTKSGRKLTTHGAWNGVLDVLYSGEGAYADLRAILTLAMEKGNGDYLLQLADGANGRDGKGGYSAWKDAYTVIHCADEAQATGEAELAALRAELAAKAPLITKHSPLRAIFDPDCRSWPYRSTEKPHTVKYTGTAPILVVGSTGDPATPYAGAEKLTAGLGKAVLLTRDGEGHVAYGRSACIRTAVHAYLVDGTVPAAGTRCATDAAD